MFDRKKYEGKRALRRWPKWLPAAAAVALIATLAVGGTLAWLSAYTQPVKNTFVMGHIDPEVEESFHPDQGVKSDIRVTNHGNVPAYVRVALVFTWREGAESGQNPGNTGTIVGGTPVEGTDYTFSLGQNWVKGSDGYYYYKSSVAPDGTTPDSLGEVCVQDTSEMAKQYNLDVQVIADSIQASPETAVTSQWGSRNGGAVTGVNTDGTLMIDTEASGS